MFFNELLASPCIEQSKYERLMYVMHVRVSADYESRNKGGTAEPRSLILGWSFFID